jgi:hypothetical protein
VSLWIEGVVLLAVGVISSNLDVYITFWCLYFYRTKFYCGLEPIFYRRRVELYSWRDFLLFGLRSLINDRFMVVCSLSSLFRMIFFVGMFFIIVGLTLYLLIGLKLQQI